MRRKVISIALIVMFFVSVCVGVRICQNGEQKGEPHLELLVTAYEPDDTMAMHVNSLCVGEKEVNEIAKILYTSQYPASVYDKKNNTVYYSSRVEKETGYGDELFSYNLDSQEERQLTTDIYGINYIYPTDDAIYLVAAMRGTHYITVLKYVKETKELQIFDAEGKWNFEIFSYDIFHDKFYASACLVADQDAALEEANENGTKYIAPDYTVFEFSNDFNNPRQILHTDRKLIRRIAPRPDGKLFLTLAESYGVYDPEYLSYIMDPETGNLDRAANIDDIISVSQFAYYLSDNNVLYFIASEDNIRGIYTYNFEDEKVELIFAPEEGYLNSCFAFP